MEQSLSMDCDAGSLTLKDGTVIPTRTVIWAAGVRSVKLPSQLGAEVDRAGRVIVEKTLQVPNYPEIFAIGDNAHFEQDGRPLPTVAPVATQQAAVCVRNILHLLRGGSNLENFRYKDVGGMGTGIVAVFARLGGSEGGPASGLAFGCLGCLLEALSDQEISPPIEECRLGSPCFHQGFRFAVQRRFAQYRRQAVGAVVQRIVVVQGHALTEYAAVGTVVVQRAAGGDQLDGLSGSQRRVPVRSELDSCTGNIRIAAIGQGQHAVDTLKYKTPFFPYVTLFGIWVQVFCLVVIAFTPDLRSTLYAGVPMQFISCFLASFSFIIFYYR